MQDKKGPNPILKYPVAQKPESLWPQTKQLSDICKAEERCAEVAIKLRNFSFKRKEKMEQQTAAERNTSRKGRRGWSELIIERKHTEKWLEINFVGIAINPRVPLKLSTYKEVFV